MVRVAVTDDEKDQPMVTMDIRDRDHACEKSFEFIVLDGLTREWLRMSQIFYGAELSYPS